MRNPHPSRPGLFTPFFLTLFFLAFLGLTGCVSSGAVTAKQWQTCTEKCRNDGGLIEACNELIKGKGCHCANHKIYWYD